MYEVSLLPGVYKPIQSLEVGLTICVQVTANGLPAASEVGLAAKLTPGLLILKALLVVPVRPVDDAVSVYPVPAWLMLKSLNEATPETAFFTVAPLRIPPLGLVPIATVIDAVEDVTVLPKLSRTATAGGPDRLLPAAAFPGCVVKASDAAAPALILNALLDAPVSPVDDAVKV